MDYETAFATVLRQCRHEAGLTQESLALEAEVDRSYISLLERGKHNVTLKMLLRLCQVMNIEASEFVSRLKNRLGE